jgi:hypothetical protein
MVGRLITYHASLNNSFKGTKGKELHILGAVGITDL